MRINWQWDVIRISDKQWPAYFAHLERLDPVGHRQRFGTEILSDVLDDHRQTLNNAQSSLLAICLDRKIRATAFLTPVYRCGAKHNIAHVFEAALTVEPAWRRHGLGQALIFEALSLVSQLGGKDLMLDGLAAAPELRQFAIKLAAELMHDGRDCQGWLPASPGHLRSFEGWRPGGQIEASCVRRPQS